VSTFGRPPGEEICEVVEANIAGGFTDRWLRRMDRQP
jgi:hypothetical protein